MAKQVLAQQDFNWIELLKVRLQNLASAPANPQAGWAYYDTTLNKARYWNGTAWVAFDGSDIPDSTVTSAKIANGAIVNEDINASAAIALSKLATDPLARANHTGTQPASTISDFTEAAQDAAGALFAAGTRTGITATYDDANNEIDLAVTDSPTVGGASAAQLRDRSTHTGTQPASTISDLATAILARSQHTGTQTASTISDFTEAAQDAAGALLASGTRTGITATYDDANNELDLAVTDSPTVAGQTPANLRDRSTHTGTQTASTISDLTTAIQAVRLDQHAAPTADVSFNNRKITALADPTADTDAANKRYVDLSRQGIRLKDAVRVKTTANITLSGTQTIDGIALVAGNRVLVANQTNPAENGIYVVGAGAWTRATDADAFGELTDGATVWVNEGTQGNTTWAQINTLTALTDAQSWVQQGAAASYTAGNGLTLTGSDFAVGAGTGISVAADTVAIDTAVVARKFTAVIGNGSLTAIPVTHSLGNQWVTCQVFRNSTPFDLIDCEVELTDTNTVTLRFATAPAASAFRVVVIG